MSWTLLNPAWTPRTARGSLCLLPPASCLLIVLCLTAGAGCARRVTAPSQSSQSSQATLGQSFDLRVGASAALQGGLTITFDRVGSDSRCPVDVMCVWAGDAVVMVSASQASRGRAELELHTVATQSEKPYLAYSIKLTALAPYPRASQPARPEDYVATLVVTTR